ncbi:MAG: PaaI family thioesterase [Sphingomonadales bacterium]|nr:MAG: PaaI family thioesterase [Sphingomonadales bacterium]
MTDAPIRKFQPERFFAHRFVGHGDTLGIDFRAHGPDWAELILPYNERLIGDPASGVLASGPILALMDMATSVAVWLKIDAFVPHATLDLRIDYLRPARPGNTVVGRGECYRVTRSIAFVRGQAHDGDPDDPLANVAGTFMSTEGYW